MKTKKYDESIVKKFFMRNKIATMEQLKALLGTNVNMTIIRKLRQLSYLSSYSHRGKYYTLNEIAEFDDLGLWTLEPAMFSKYGTLVKTVKAFIDKSDDGLSAGGLESLLKVDPKESLLNLFRKKEVQRAKISGKYVYFSSDSKIRGRQTLLRNDRAREPALQATSWKSDLSAHELKAAILLFFTFLDEKQRRLYAGLESLRIGFGGDKMIADLLGVDPHTVSKGRRELLSGEILPNGIRKKGAGRIPVEKKARNFECHRGTDGRRDRRRSDYRTKMDPKNDRKNILRTETAWNCGVREYRRKITRKAGFFDESKSQKVRKQRESGPEGQGRTIQIYLGAARLLCFQRVSRHQRGRQEKRTDRQFQKRRSHLSQKAGGCKRIRFSLRCERQGNALRHLRYGGQQGGRVCRNEFRHAFIRG